MYICKTNTKLIFLQDESSKISKILTMTICDTNNTAQWIGVQKLNNEQNLMQFLGPYLIFLAAASVFTSVSYHQKRKRLVFIEIFAL